ncbi:hypothetical protein L3049_02275 [Labilibaculum sp. DW002]|uniref:DUF4760 domain-containing protein n=1 Tax=Paralabilibaculum antarcticum TaxID=2912572 RepID=A0ABT5VQP0_9BACT|nr:hypothetical protein [Labilibaculum sp. DW002]MDE5416818.1 hypothetical protein [Labilibaculum sp. DW002]
MKKSLLIILGIFLLAILSNTEPLKNIVSPYIHTIANLTAAGGLVALFFQFKRERDLNEADFILRINNDFMMNESMSRIYKLLEESKVEGQKENPFSQDDIIDMANYLTYFDPFYSLIERKIVKIESIDPVLAYRFYLAVNNKYMQQMLICSKDKEIAWESIYKLYSYWGKYRENLGREIWQSNHSLSKNDCYNKIVRS